MRYRFWCSFLNKYFVDFCVNCSVWGQYGDFLHSSVVYSHLNDFLVLILFSNYELINKNHILQLLKHCYFLVRVYVAYWQIIPSKQTFVFLANNLRTYLMLQFSQTVFFIKVFIRLPILELVTLFKFTGFIILKGWILVMLKL